MITPDGSYLDNIISVLMLPIIMKKYFSLLIISITCISCNTTVKKENRSITLGDTITTSSGLKYIFLKEGSGRPILMNSKVDLYTELYLNDSDSLIWTTAEDKDSIFSFIHGKTSLIKGFKELHNYLVEGDEVIALIPDSLAYGKKGGNGIPPETTLVYNPLIVKRVSLPKKLMNDTLQNIATYLSAKAAIDFYSKVINGTLKNKYHTDLDFIFAVLDSLSNNNLYSQTLELSTYFRKNNEDNYETGRLAYYQILALEKQGKINEAIAIIKEQLPLENDLEWGEWWKDKKKYLEEKLHQKIH